MTFDVPFVNIKLWTVCTLVINHLQKIKAYTRSERENSGR